MDREAENCRATVPKLIYISLTGIHPEGRQISQKTHLRHFVSSLFVWPTEIYLHLYLYKCHRPTIIKPKLPSHTLSLDLSIYAFSEPTVQKKPQQTSPKETTSHVSHLPLPQRPPDGVAVPLNPPPDKPPLRFHLRLPSRCGRVRKPPPEQQQQRQRRHDDARATPSLQRPDIHGTIPFVDALVSPAHFVAPGVSRCEKIFFGFFFLSPPRTNHLDATGREKRCCTMGLTDGCSRSRVQKGDTWG